MQKLRTGLCVLALGAGLLAGCTERSDRISEQDRPTMPSASPATSPPDTTRPSPTMPPSTPSTAPSSPSTSGESTK